MAHIEPSLFGENFILATLHLIYEPYCFSVNRASICPLKSIAAGSFQELQLKEKESKIRMFILVDSKYWRLHV